MPGFRSGKIPCVALSRTRARGAGRSTIHLFSTPEERLSEVAATLAGRVLPASRQMERQVDGQQPPEFLILAARALSAWSSGTSPKHFAKHSSNLR